MNAGLFVLVVLLFLGAEAFKVGVLTLEGCIFKSKNRKEYFQNYVYPRNRMVHIHSYFLFKVGSNLVLAEWTAHYSAETNWNYIGYYRFIYETIRIYIRG